MSSTGKRRSIFHRGWGLWRIPAAFGNVRAGGARHGFGNYAAMRLGQRRMLRIAERIPPGGVDHGNDTLDVHFLTGQRHWQYTAYCARSLLHHTSDHHIRPVIHDDGTLRAPHRDRLRRVLPMARIVSAEEKRDQLDGFLPASRFPVLREERFSFPFFRKFHIHAATPGHKLYLDSDMLFHRAPKRLLHWLRDPSEACYMVDAPGYFYGYDLAELESLNGKPLAPRVNAGLVGLDRDTMDWDRLEYWARTLVDRSGLEFHLEQALTAMEMSHCPSAAFPRDDYVVKPDRDEALRPSAAMHHYTGVSRAWYYRFGWRRLLRELSDAAVRSRAAASLWLAGWLGAGEALAFDVVAALL